MTGNLQEQTNMNWTLTDTFDYHHPDAKYWRFDNFEEAMIAGNKLTTNIEMLYLWKETIGQPIKWMKITHNTPNRA